MIKGIVFAAASIGFFVFSMPWLRRPRSHGFYRFFAFEFLTALILTNTDRWFAEPFSPLQILSWILLTISLLLAIPGFLLLRSIGKPSGSFEDTTTLVIAGPYRWIRHPLYTSLLLLTFGSYLKEMSVLSAALGLAACAALIATAKAEERENLEKFGTAYLEYMKQTAMFIPRLL